MKSNYLTTKQFADLCKVEKRTLFYYDEINLLKPIQVTDNGYRYYTPDQFDTMSMIKALQSIGMSLSDIKSLMKEKDLTRSKAVLQHQISKLQEKQLELKVMEQFLIQTSDQLDQYLLKGLNQYFTEDLKDTYLEVEPHDQYNSFINYLNNGYHLGCIIDQYPSNHLPSFTYKLAPSQEHSNWVKPSGTYASIYKTARNGTIKTLMDEWMGFLSDKNIATEGPHYFEDLASDFISVPDDAIVFKLSIKITDH